MRKLIIVLLLLANLASATTYTWSLAANGAWANAANWTPNGIPTTGDVAIFSNATGRTITLTNEACDTLVIALGAWTLQTGTATVATAIDYRSSSASTISARLLGTAALSVTNGTLTLSGVNTYSGGATLNTGSQLTMGNIACLGTGTFTINGGQISYSANAVSPTNTVVVNGNFANVENTGYTTVGFSGPMTIAENATFNQVYTRTITFSSTIENNSTFSRVGLGSVVFSGSMFGTGVINVVTGAVTLSCNNLTNGGNIVTLQTNGTLLLNQTYCLGTNVLYINGGNLSAGSLFTLTGSPPIQVNANFTYSENAGAAMTINCGMDLNVDCTISMPYSGRALTFGAANIINGNGHDLSFAGGNPNGGTVTLGGRIDNVPNFYNLGCVMILSGSNNISTSINNNVGGSGNVVGTMILNNSGCLGYGVFNINGGLIGCSGGNKTMDGRCQIININSNFTFGAATYNSSLIFGTNLVVITTNVTIYTGYSSVGLTFGGQVISTNYNLTFNSTTIGGLLTLNSNVFLGTGMITLTGTTTGAFILGGSNEFSSLSVNGNVNLVVNNSSCLGAGTTIFNHPNAIISSSVSAGSIGLDGRNTIIFSNNVTFGLSGYTKSIIIGTNISIIATNISFINGFSSTGLNFAGPINLDGYTLTYSGAGTLSIVNIIGTGTIKNNSSGTFTFLTDTSFEGIVTNASGTLRIGATNSFANCTVATGAGTYSFYNSLRAYVFGGLIGTNNLSLNNNAAQSVLLYIGNKNINSSYGGKLTGAGSITKIGTGIFTITGTNAYTGPTVVSNGIFRVDGQGATSAVIVASSGILGGNGIISSVVTNSGTITADGFDGGSGTGVLTLNSNLVFNAGSTNWVDISSSANDTININRNLTLNGIVYVKNAGDMIAGTYNIMTYNGTLSGSIPTVIISDPLFSGSIDTNTIGLIKLTLTGGGEGPTNPTLNFWMFAKILIEN